MTVGCRHDGKDEELSTSLAEVFGIRSGFHIAVGDPDKDVSGKCRMGLGIVPVSLRLVDNGWAGYHNTQLSIVVDNVSAIPLDVIVYQMLDSDLDWPSVEFTDALKSYVNNNLKRTPLSYLTGEVDSWNQDMHVSRSVVKVSGSGAYAIAGISTDDLYKSLIFDGFGNDRMYHLVDVTVKGRRLYTGEVGLTDALSNGSSAYDAIYFSDWNSKGVWLYSNDVLLSSPGNFLVHFPNVTPLKLDRLRQRNGSSSASNVVLWYDDGVFRIYTPYTQVAAFGLKLTLRFHGTVTGYVQTDPKGIWGSVKDNYCYADFDKTLKGVSLAAFSSNVSADGGAVKEAMDAIYAQTFEDKEDGKKFQHAAHPISMECSVDAFIEGSAGDELYPLKIAWEHPYVEYYHEQDAKTYSCEMTTETTEFNLVFVEK